MFEDNNSNNNHSLDLIIISDLHYFAPELGAGEPAFYRDKWTESKLTEHSKEIIVALFKEISQLPEKNILICGDLSHHGEKYNHLQLAEMLNQLKEQGKNIFVIPGNHDINNYSASRFEGRDYYLIDNVSPKDFSEIYKEFGYSKAISRDTTSLSYFAELDNQYDIICLDAAKYSIYSRNNMPSSGILNQNTLIWLQKVLTERKKLNKNFIVMLHFNLIEHFPWQASNPISNSYILMNANELLEILNKFGVQLVFTGHFHANDIVKHGNIYDIETGSAITFPHSYRIVNIKDKIASISTKNINDSAFFIDDQNFAEYSKNKTTRGLNNFFSHNWKKLNKNYDSTTTNKLKESFAKIVFAHYYGDESIDLETKQFCDELIKSDDKILKLIGRALKAVYNDPEPKDRNIEIKLNS